MDAITDFESECKVLFEKGHIRQIEHNMMGQSSECSVKQTYADRNMFTFFFVPVKS